MFHLALPLGFAVTSEGKTRHAPLLFSPFSTASCAQARSPFPWKFTPFRLRYASCKAAALLKVRSPKSAIFGGGKSHDRFLEARFSLFLRESVKVSRSPYPQKFTLSALIRSLYFAHSENAHSTF